MERKEGKKGSGGKEIQHGCVQETVHDFKGIEMLNVIKNLPFVFILILISLYV